MMRSALGVACQILIVNLLLAQPMQVSADRIRGEAAGTIVLPLQVHGWTRIDTARRFVGPRLYDLIDGGADLVFEYGFRTACASTYRDSGARILSAELYEMQDAEAAFGVYSNLSAGVGRRAGIGSGAAIGTGYIIFWKGTVQGSITLLEGPPLDDSLLVTFSRELCAQLPEGPGPPSLVTRMYTAGFRPQEVVAVHGTLGLMNYSPFHGADNFTVDRGVVGQRASCGYLLLQYPDEMRARDAFRKGADRLMAAEGRNFTQVGDSCNFRLSNGKSVAIKLTNRWILGLSGRDTMSNPCSFEALESLVLQ